MERDHRDKPRHLRLVPKREQRRDEHVQRALKLMDEQLDRRWTVSELARHVGLSRPAFARRFKESTGKSPLRYLANKRMERAAGHLGRPEAARELVDVCAELVAPPAGRGQVVPR